jgi:hypothetical protein
MTPSHKRPLMFRMDGEHRGESCVSSWSPVAPVFLLSPSWELSKSIFRPTVGRKEEISW